MNALHLKIGKKSSAAGTRPVPKGSLAHQLSSDPFLDWIIIVTMFVALSMLLVGVGTSVYLETRENLVASESLPDKKSSQLIDTALLDKVLHGFDVRAEERAAVLRNYAAPSDPTL